jgi:hypothetical protein
VRNATRSVEEASWRTVDSPPRCGFGAAVRVLSGAAIVGLMALASSAVGATEPLGNPTAVSTPSIFAPVSTPAFAIRDLSYFVLGICAVIFIVVAGLLAYSLIRFRRRPADADREPPQVYGSNQIELAWTVVPVLIVVILFLATARYIFGIEGLQATPNALQITVVGHQWWWEIRYPDLGIITANELHVPASDPANPTPGSSSPWSQPTSSIAFGCPNWPARWTSSPTRSTACGSLPTHRGSTSVSALSIAVSSTPECCCG